MSATPAKSAAEQRFEAFTHALGAPLCALEVVLAAKAHLPAGQGELLEEAVVRLRQILAEAQADM